MNRGPEAYVVVLVLLAGVAIFLARDASRRGEGMAAVIMLVIAAIFWKRVQQRRS